MTIARVSLNDAGQMRQWDAFVRLHPRGTPFHISGWLESIGLTYKYRPLLYACYDDSGRMCGVFPGFYIKSLLTGHRLVSIPFSDYGGPLFVNDEADGDWLPEILDGFRERCNCLEIRGGMGANNGFTSLNQYRSHVLELSPDPDMVMKKIDRRTTRYSIRKAQKSGIKIRQDNTIEGMREFFRLNIITRKKHGLPSQPWEFFKNVHGRLVENGDAFVLLALDNARAVAAGLFLKLGDTIFYKYNASDPECLVKKSPNHLLTWHVIEKACRMGFKFLDFGRTSTSNPGLAKYKELWGAKPADLPYFYYPKTKMIKPTTENDLSYRIFTEIGRHLPNYWLTAFGARIYRHIG